MRYGYRSVHVLLGREGWTINMKKTRRTYNELGLQLRNKHPKRRVKLREDRQEATSPTSCLGRHRQGLIKAKVPFSCYFRKLLILLVVISPSLVRRLFR